jgi:hypothetical protein
MKKVLSLAILLLITSASVLGQGTVILSNQNLTDSNGDLYQAPINGDTTGLTAQLFLSGPGGVLTPLLPTTTFQTGAAAAYVVPQTVEVPGVNPGGSASFRLRIWEGVSYDNAVRKLESDVFTVNGLGGVTDSGTIQPPRLNGLHSPATFPEPSAMAVMTFGLGILYLRRRIAH